MTLPHLLNVIVHVAAGALALFIGFTILFNIKGSLLHKKLGRIFCYLGIVVCGAAAVGLIFFRFLPLFAVITLLVAYQLASGWHVIYTKQNGPNKLDLLWTIFAWVTAALLAPLVLTRVVGSQVILLSTFGALAFVLVYDAIRWLFPRKWYRFLWRYEHSYKLLSALFGMLSSLVGNTIRAGQPWSQIIPSALGLICIGYFFYKTSSEDRKLFSKDKNNNQKRI